MPDSRILRILFLTSSMEGGGAERVAAHLCNAWVERGHEVTLMPTYSGRGGCAYPLHPGVRLDFLADHAEGAPGRLRRLLALRRFIRRSGFDVLVSFLTDVNVAALLAAKGTGVPVVVAERTYPPLRSPPLGRVISLLRRLTYRYAAAVVVQSTDAAEWVRRNCRGARPVVIANPLVLPLPETNPALSPEGVGLADRRLVLAVGRLNPSKRFHLLVEAFARLAPAHPDWDVVILGEGPERAALEAQVAASGLAGRVQMPGFAGNLGDWYPRADIHAMPSAYEGFPNTLVEAMAHGLPAITFDIKTGPREILQHGRAGVLLPDDDQVGRMAAALEELIRDPDRRGRLGELGTHVRETYGLSAILKDWNTVIERAAGQKKCPQT